jgi:hypothetical protein
MLPVNQEHAFRQHLSQCAACEQDVTELKNVVFALQKSQRPVAVPPPWLATRVINILQAEEKTKRRTRLFPVPLKVWAMVASFLFLFSMNSMVVRNYLAGLYTEAVPAPVTDGIPEQDVSPLNELVDSQHLREFPRYPAGNSEAAEMAELLELEPQDPVQVETDLIDSLRQTAVSPEVYVVPQSPRLVRIDPAMIPSPEIFINRKRVVESVMLKVAVSRMDLASQQLASTASLQGVSPTLEDVFLTMDGRLIKVYRYEVPFMQAHQFVARTVSVGRLFEEERMRHDISTEYAQKLNHYYTLVATSQASSGSEAEQLNYSINTLVGELSQMNKYASDTQSVIVWLES